MIGSYVHIMGLIMRKLISSPPLNYSTIMNELKPMFNGCVLMNDTAINDQSVINALQRLSEDNFEFKSICNDRVTIDEWINS